ncbi:MAG: hypothetical protein R3310_00850 [Candidatus Competibacteraceae bacterium]|nr:hypothetical protein [Candidatus Competibacteraceae bacterium]
MSQDAKPLSPERWLLLAAVLVALLAGLLALPDAAGKPLGGDFILRLLLWQGLIWGGYGLIRFMLARGSIGLASLHPLGRCSRRTWR